MPSPSLRRFPHQSNTDDENGVVKIVIESVLLRHEAVHYAPAWRSRSELGPIDDVGPFERHRSLSILADPPEIVDVHLAHSRRRLIMVATLMR